MTEKFRGVFPHKDGGYVASIGAKYLGYFRDFEEAKKARIQGEIDLVGHPYDRREILVFDDHAQIPLHGRRGVFYGYATVDVEDLHLVRGIGWTKGPNGYAIGRPAGSGQAVAMHRHVMGGLPKGQCYDHSDRDKLNNRRSNLRVCKPGENTRNTVMSKNNTSGFKGVRKTATGRWQARITSDYREIHIGTYDTKAEAAAAYDGAAKLLHLDFASPNSEIVKPLDLDQQAD